MISSRAEVCVYLRGEPPFQAGWEIIPGRFALFLKGATPLLQQWQLQMQETHIKSPSSFTEVAGVEVFWISSELQC